MNLGNNLFDLNVQFADIDMISGTDGTGRNLNTFSTNLAAFSQMALSQRKWKCDNLKPLDFYSDLIEYYLFFKGQCFIVPTADGWKVKQGSANTGCDEFGRPLKFSVTGFNGTGTEVYNYDDVIWIKNTIQCTPTLYWILKYCDRIAKIERTMDLNIDAQKTPYVIKADPLTYLSVKNIFEKIQTMDEVVVVDQMKNIIDNIDILKLDAPYLVDKLFDQKINERNDLLNFLGINTVYEKNAHLIYEEATATDDLTESFNDMFNSPRKTACKVAKQKGLNLTFSVLQEVRKDESLHNNAPPAD